MRTKDRILITGAILAVMVVLAGCAATESMWYDTGPGYTSTSTVYYRPGTTVQYYDYGYPYYYSGPTYYYYDPYPYGIYNFGFSYRDRDDHREHIKHHSGGGVHHGGGHHR